MPNLTVSFERGFEPQNIPTRYFHAQSATNLGSSDAYCIVGGPKQVRRLKINRKHLKRPKERSYSSGFETTLLNFDTVAGRTNATAACALEVIVGR